VNTKTRYLMNNLTDLFNSEFKNLYALEKECVEIFEAVQEEIEDQDLMQIAKELAQDSGKQFELLQEALRKTEVNPGNTTDSVAQEMIENLKEISSLEIPQEVKDESILGSFNRLNYYRMACYENTYELAKKLEYDDLIDLFYYDLEA
jgi:ferritin-like metal-binding protein YciE